MDIKDLENQIRKRTGASVDLRPFEDSLADLAENPSAFELVCARGEGATFAELAKRLKWSIGQVQKVNKKYQEISKLIRLELQVVSSVRARSHQKKLDRQTDKKQRIAEELRALAEKLGKPGIMPKTTELRLQDSALANAVSSLGGIKAAAQFSGLRYERTTRAREVSGEQVIAQIKSLAAELGRPDSMPKVEEIKQALGPPFYQKILALGGKVEVARLAGFGIGGTFTRDPRAIEEETLEFLTSYFDLRAPLPRELITETFRRHMSNTKKMSMARERANGASIEKIGNQFGLTKQSISKHLKPWYPIIEAVIAQRELIAVTDYIDRNLKDGRICKKDVAGIHKNAWDLFLSNYFSEPDELDEAWIKAGLAVPRLMFREGHTPLKDAYRGSGRSELKTIELIKLHAADIGAPTLMPKQLQLPPAYRSLVSFFGGQSQIAKKAGLVYQGQTVGEDGRTYWTDERVVEALRTVASARGLPNIMPSQLAVKEFFAGDKSIIENLLGTQRRETGGRSWADLAELAGLRLAKQSYIKKDIRFLRDFVASLGSHLDVMDASEIYVLFQQQGVGKSPKRSSGFNKVLDAIQSGFLPKEELKKWAAGSDSDQISGLLGSGGEWMPGQSSSTRPISSATKKSVNTDQSHQNDVKGEEQNSTELPELKARDVIESLDANIQLLRDSDSDEEAVEFFIAKAKSKLWALAFAKGDAVLHSLQEAANDAVSTTVSAAFRQEYLEARDLQLPSGYSFTDLTGERRQPKLMQKLIALRVKRDGRVLNLSGTGTGKTLSAILASRLIDAGLTVVVCPNSTVSNWAKNILSTFSDSDVSQKTWLPNWRPNSKFRYLIVNHEMLTDQKEATIKGFIEDNVIDFVVIDEIHRAKQRKQDDESQRRRLLNGLITDLPNDRPSPSVLGLSATPVINTLMEGRSLVELVTSEEHPAIGSELNIQNCMKLYQKFCTLGFRQRSEQLAQQNTTYYPIECSELLGDILQLGARPTPLAIEAILLPAKLQTIGDCLRPKTVIFTEYVTGITSQLASLAKSRGYSVGLYTGEDKSPTDYRFDDSLDEFINGDLQVLVASTRTLATGVDGLQTVCNNVIFATLPWTNTDMEQALGRFDRQGFIFEELAIHIPRTFGTFQGTHWSYCDMKLARLESKKDMASASVDGLIPDEQQMLSPSKAGQYWQNWLRRLEGGEIQVVERKKIKVPLSGSETEKRNRLAKYGDFSQMNHKWNNSRSGTTHQRLQKDATEWCQYHTLYQQHRKDWPVQPIEEISKWLQQRTGWIVADLGCGEDLLRESVSDSHEVLSFDHVAINEHVTACDLSTLPVDDDAVDVAVFSLSLMGKNFGDYLDEAYRILKPLGFLHIVEPESRFKSRDQFSESLRRYGFDVASVQPLWKFVHIIASKNTAVRSESRAISF